MESIYKVYSVANFGQGYREERKLVLITENYTEAINRADEISDDDSTLCYGEVIEKYIAVVERKVY